MVINGDFVTTCGEVQMNANFATIKQVPPVGYIIAFPTHARWHHLRKNLSMPLGSGESFRFFVGLGVVFLDTEIIERGFPSLAKS